MRIPLAFGRGFHEIECPDHQTTVIEPRGGIPLADEPALLARAITLVQAVTDVPLSIDSSIIEALEAGLAVYQGKPPP